MKIHLYLSVIPEALVFSMLPPAEFGRYLALGADKRTRAQALFAEVDAEQVSGAFNLDALRERCKPHQDGRPRKSSYISIYRTLEHIPVSALLSVFLTTRDGTVLELKPSSEPPAATEGFHFYQELCPVTPSVVARLGPAEFSRFITSGDQPISLPRLIFADLEIGPLATDPAAEGRSLPYQNIKQLRHCLEELGDRPDKTSKIVSRELQRDIPYWMIKTGIYAGDQTQLAFFRMPSEDELRASHPHWWSSARAVELL